MLQRIVALMPLGAAVVDVHRDVVYLNDRAKELGLVRDRQLDDQAWQAAQQALTGVDVEFDLQPAKRAARPVRAVGARAGPAAQRRRPPVRRGLRPRPVRLCADGGDQARLRGQRQPRAQDPGGRHGSARRGPAGFGRRLRNRAPVRREGARRSQPAGGHGRRADRAVPAAGRRTVAQRHRGRRRHRCVRSDFAPQGGRRQRRYRGPHRRAQRSAGAGRRNAAGHRAGQPGIQRDRLFAVRVRRCRSAVAVAATTSRSP